VPSCDSSSLPSSTSSLATATRSPKRMLRSCLLHGIGHLSWRSQMLHVRQRACLGDLAWAWPHCRRKACLSNPLGSGIRFTTDLPAPLCLFTRGCPCWSPAVFSTWMCHLLMLCALGKCTKATCVWISQSPPLAQFMLSIWHLPLIDVKFGMCSAVLAKA